MYWYMYQIVTNSPQQQSLFCFQSSYPVSGNELRSLLGQYVMLAQDISGSSSKVRVLRTKIRKWFKYSKWVHMNMITFVFDSDFLSDRFIKHFTSSFIDNTTADNLRPYAGILQSFHSLLPSYTFTVCSTCPGVNTPFGYLRNEPANV